MINFEHYYIKHAMQIFREGKLRMIRNEKIKQLTKSQIDILVEDSYFNGKNYLSLFSTRHRTRLEEAMLIYACHIKYLLAQYDLVEHQLWHHRKSLPSIPYIIFSKAAEQANCKSFSRDAIVNHVDSVNEQLKEVFSTGLETKTFTLTLGDKQ